MPSVYDKNGILYISWYDWLADKSVNRSTGLKATKANKKKAKKLAKELEHQLKQKREKYKSLGLKKETIGYAINKFLQNNNNKNASTIGEYKRVFKKFNEKFDRTDPCATVTKLKCEEWLIELRDATYFKKGKTYNYSKNTLYVYTKVLKKFLNFLFEYNYVPVFRLNKDVVHRPEVKQLIIFSDDDLQVLIDGLKEKNSNFRTTFYMLLYTGLRPSDIYNIEVKDIDLKKKEFRYYSEKTDEYFQLPLHDELVPILSARIAEVKEGRVFQFETINNIGKAYRRYLKSLGMDKKGYNLRTFRKTFITLMHENGADLATVAKLVGHKQITTTEKYYNKLSMMKKAGELSKLCIRKKPQED